MSRRTVHIALYDTVADWELGYLTAHLQRPLFQRHHDTFELRFVGATAEPVRTMGGMQVVPDLTLDELDPASSDLLVLAGSSTWEKGELAVWGRVARRFLDAGTPVAAICGATFGLAAEGLLDDREHTSGAAEYLAATGYAGGAHYVEADAVTDRGLTTAGPAHAVAFAREVFAVLDSHTPEVREAWFRLFHDQDAAAFGVLAANA